MSTITTSQVNAIVRKFNNGYEKSDIARAYDTTEEEVDEALTAARIMRIRIEPPPKDDPYLQTLHMLQKHIQKHGTPFYTGVVRALRCVD